MAATPTTKSQVQAYRFVLRRMEHALVRKDAVMLHDPMRTQVRATAVGVVLGVLALAGFALFALFKPSGGLGDNAIVMAKDSGSLYVRVDGVLHPVMNLASARLIVGQAVALSSVSDSALADVPRGALLGIPGGPSLLPSASARTADIWTVCDTLTPDSTAPTSEKQAAGATVTTTVIAGELSAGPVPLSGGGSLLVTLPVEGRAVTYLIYDGKRAQIDTSDHRVTRALGLLDDPVGRPVSAALVNAIPEEPPVVAPVVTGRGTAPTFAGAEKMPAAVIGSVLQVSGMAKDQYYVVLKDGVQPVAQVVAQLLQFASGGGLIQVPPSLIGPLPSPRTKLAVDNLPQQTPALVDAAASPVSCMSWDGSGGTQATVGGQQQHRELTPRVLAGAGLPIPATARVVSLAQADGNGPLLDSVYVPPATGALVRAVAAPGTDAGPLFLVNDTGVRFGVADLETAGVLGLAGDPDPAPNQIISLLPLGPELSQRSALLAHDGVSSDPQASELPKPR